MRAHVVTLGVACAALALSELLTLTSGIVAAQDRIAQAQVRPPRPRNEALRFTKAGLVKFDSAPFPYDGMVPDKDTPFLDVVNGDRKGHKARIGRVFWEDVTYREKRVLLQIPRGFDFTKPAVMVIFFHGHGATLLRDVRDRQLVPAQVAAANINAVLVAPQFALDAPDSSPGKFWEPGGFARFVEEAGAKLAALHGNPASGDIFARMPIVLVSYSGGYLATAFSLELGGLDDNRLRGVVLLDSLYGEYEKFVTWIANHRQAFVVSAYTESTERQNATLKSMLKDAEVPFDTELKPARWKHGVTFLAAVNPEIKHEDFVTQAWTTYPVKDLLARLDEYRR